MSKVEKGYLPKRLISKFIDYILVALTTVTLFFLCFMPTFKGTTTYIQDQATISQKFEYYGLNIKASTPDYEPYKEVVEDVFFNKLYDKIYEISNENKEENVSVEYLYNVNFLLLPADPTSKNYSNDYFAYQIDENGNPLIDKIGLIRTDNNLNLNGMHNLFDIYANAFEKLQRIILTFDEEYRVSYTNVVYLEQVSVISSFAISSAIFLIIVPLISKHRQSIGCQILKLGLVDKKQYKTLPWYRGIIYSLPYILVFGVGVYFLNIYSICILIILPIFLEIIMMVFNKKNADFGNLVSFSETIDLTVEKNPDEITEPDYLEKLENLAAKNEEI